MKLTLVAAAGLGLAAPAAASAQIQPPAPVERAAPPRPARPAAAPYRPAPPHPGPAAPMRPVTPGVVAPGVVAAPYRRIPEAPSARPAPVAPVEAAPRYGVTRTAPRVGIDPDIRARNRHHWGWNGRRIHAAGYVFPRGHRYHRCHIGQRLPLIFLSEIYYFTDYAEAGFDDPPDGYEWIRYGPDLLLVDLATGEVVDVEYDVFD